MTTKSTKPVADHAVTVEMLEFPEGATSIGNILAALFDIAEPRLDDASLRRLSMAALEEAGQIAANARQTVLNVAMLAATDGQTGAGSLRDGDDVAALLFTLGSTLDAIGGLIEVGDNAERARHG